jgi:glycosyltransferase involved in cell wall biosynthesis
MQKTLPTVLHVIPWLKTSGAEHVLASLLTAKRPQPVSQVVVNLLRTPADETTLAELTHTNGIVVHQFGGQSTFALPFILFRLSRLIRQIRPAAIQSWLYYGDLTSLWALELSGLRANTRLYWGVRSSDMDPSHYRRALGWTIKACAKRSARPDAVVANSFAGRKAHQAIGFAPRAFPVIPNGIDTNRFRPDASVRARMRTQFGVSGRRPLVVHVARVDPMKDHASLIAVAAALPDIQFVTAGAGTEKIEAPANLRALGIRRDMPDLYAAADLALSTSVFGEGFPNAVAEPMACGIPVVATDVGDSRRIVGDTGFVVSPRDVSGMVSAIGGLLAEPEAKRAARGATARTRIEDHYSLDRMVSAFDSLHLHGTLPASNDEAADATRRL